MKAFEIFNGDVIKGIKVNWPAVGRPYVLIGHPDSADNNQRIPLSDELLESLGLRA